MHLLPGTRRLRLKLPLNNYFCWLRNGTSNSFNLSILDNYINESHNFVSGQQRRIPITFSVSKNIRLCSRQDFDHDAVEEVSISSKTLELEERSEAFRNLLYPASNDPIIVQLKSCESVNQVKGIIDDNSSCLTSKHFCQTILVLWNLIQNNCELNSHCTLDINPNINQCVMNVPKRVTFPNTDGNDIFLIILKALDYLSADSESLNADELVLSILYFSRFGINLKNSSIQNMLQKINKLLTSEDHSVFPLSLLSRLTLIFVDHEELWTKLLLIKTLPFVYKHFDECSNAEDFKALTISMISTSPFLREELLVEYEALTDELLRNGILTKDESSAIVKSIMLLNYIYHKPAARKMIYRLLQMLSGQVNKLFLPHLIHLQRMVLINLEPHYTKVEMENAKETWSPEQIQRILQFPQSLFLMSVPPNQEGSVILKDAINQTNQIDGLLSLYFSLTAAHLDACHMFWDKVAQLLPTVNDSILDYICIRYMLFTNRINSYRHRYFESQMLSRITSELVTGSAGIRPNQFSLLAAFVLSYESGKHGATSLSMNVMPRLLSMVSQLNAYSCFTLSRAFKQAMAHKGRRGSLQACLQLDSALNVRIREILESQKNISLVTFNTLLRTCINKNESLESDLMWDIIKRCEQLDWSELTSRALRNLVYNLLSTYSLVPVALDHMTEYCLDNRHTILCETVGKLAHLCYQLGHSPNSGSRFWALTGDLIIRDFKHQNGLSLLQVALALSFFNHLTSSLNRLIFSVDFLERLDEEIKSCFSKDRYPMRIRKTLMQLNRSVCLDNPEADVPWFHSKYCKEQQSLGRLDAKRKTLFFTDVFNTLSGLTDVSNIGLNVITPYGYCVDFQLNLDTALNPLPLRDSENVAHKLALLLYYRDSYTMYERKLKGYHQMKQRHLEILGYKVIGLSDTLWNAMWMTEPTAKSEYLRNSIWPS